MKHLLFIVLLFASSISFAAPCHLTILHFNDFHGHVENAAKIAQIIKEIRKENIGKGWETIVLNGGDVVSGTPVSAKFNGQAEFLFLKAIGTSALTLGNHDFDFGMIPLVENIKNSEVTTIAANIYKRKNHKRIYPPYTVINNTCGAVGILGLAHPDTPNLTRRTNVGLFLFEDGVPATQKILPELVKISDLQIALTHEGVSRDLSLAKKFNDIDLVIGGHDHISPDRYCREVEKTPVCQTPPNGKFVGRVDISIFAGSPAEISYELIPTEGKKEDPLVKKEIKPYISAVKKEMNEVIGTAEKGYTHTRSGQSELGQLITKIIKKYTGADFAVINSGGIRQNLKKGKITVGEIEEILPFPNFVVTVSLTGADIKEIFEQAKKNSKTLQVYGFDDRELTPDRLYTVTSVDFLTGGGDDYSAFSRARKIKNSGKTIKQIVIEYIKKERRI